MSMRRFFFLALALAGCAHATQKRADEPFAHESSALESIRAINQGQYQQPGLEEAGFGSEILLPPGQELVSFGRVEMREPGWLGNGDFRRPYYQYVLRPMKYGEQAERYTFYLEQTNDHRIIERLSLSERMPTKR